MSEAGLRDVIGQGFNLAPKSCQLSDKRLGGGSNAYLACMSGALHVWELAIHSRNLGRKYGGFSPGSQS